MIAIVLWVGGISFMLTCLRPALAHTEAHDRLKIQLHAMERFFFTVWLLIVTTLATGFWMFAWVGGAGAPVSWHIMATLGLVMTGVFAWLYFLPFRRMRQAMGEGKLLVAGSAMGQIRVGAAINLGLGKLIILIAIIL